jgi:hypothetical protein
MPKPNWLMFWNARKPGILEQSSQSYRCDVQGARGLLIAQQRSKAPSRLHRSVKAIIFSQKSKKPSLEEV